MENEIQNEAKKPTVLGLQKEVNKLREGIDEIKSILANQNNQDRRDNDNQSAKPSEPQYKKSFSGRIQYDPITQSYPDKQVENKPSYVAVMNQILGDLSQNFLMETWEENNSELWRVDIIVPKELQSCPNDRRSFRVSSVQGENKLKEYLMKIRLNITNWKNANGQFVPGMSMPVDFKINNPQTLGATTPPPAPTITK